MGVCKKTASKGLTFSLSRCVGWMFFRDSTWWVYVCMYVHARYKIV